MPQLNGKVAVVTGSSRGLGRAIAEELAQEGASVVVNYRSGEALANEVAQGINSRGGRAAVRQADVGDPQQARELIEFAVSEMGRIDILVNNAGITRDRSIRKLTDEDWQEVITNNLSSVFYCTSAAIPRMIDQNHGRIISISSFVGQAGNFGQANYSASKGGIIAFTKTVALELARYDITVNGIAPGFLTTDMVQAIPEDIQDRIKERIPMRRFGEPQEIAKAVTFLSANGGYITGTTLSINGGIYM